LSSRGKAASRIDQPVTPRAAELAQTNEVLRRESGERRQVEEKLRLNQLELRRNKALLAEGQRLSLTGSFSWKMATGEITWSEQPQARCKSLE
jgi:hypothetical protein